MRKVGLQMFTAGRVPQERSAWLAFKLTKWGGDDGETEAQVLWSVMYMKS